MRKRMKDKLAALAKEYEKLYENTGLCGIDTNSVHLLRKDFEEMFPEYETRDRDDSEYATEEFTVYNGVKFFCLVNKRQEHEEA